MLWHKTACHGCAWTMTSHSCRLKPFGAELRAVRRSPWEGTHPAEALLDHRGTWADLPSLVSGADILVLTCAQNELTREMVNAALLARCRRGVLIINVARGRRVLGRQGSGLHLSGLRLSMRCMLGTVQVCRPVAACLHAVVHLPV